MSEGQVYELHLSWSQFDHLEHAADIMVLGHHYIDSMEEAVEFLAKKYIAEEAPKFEMGYDESEEAAK